MTPSLTLIYTAVYIREALKSTPLERSLGAASGFDAWKWLAPFVIYHVIMFREVEKTVFCKHEFPKVAKKIPHPWVGNLLLPHERVFHSVALSVEDQQVAVVNEPVNHGRGHRLVEEDVRPLAELEVGGEYQAALFVTG